MTTGSLHCLFGTAECELSLESLDTRRLLINGLCGNFAKAILELSPARDVYFVTYDLTSEEELQTLSDKGVEDFMEYAVHAVVGSIDGRILDGFGIHTVAETETFYAGRIIKGTHAMLNKHFVTSDFEADRAAYRTLAGSALQLEGLGRSFRYM